MFSFVFVVSELWPIQSFNPEIYLEKQKAAWECGTASVPGNEFAL